MPKYQVLLDVGYTARREVALKGRVSAKRVMEERLTRDFVLDRFYHDVTQQAVDQGLSNLDVQLVSAKKIKGDVASSTFDLVFNVFGTQDLKVTEISAEDACEKARSIVRQTIDMSGWEKPKICLCEVEECSKA